MKFSAKSMQVPKINYIIQDKSRYFTENKTGKLLSLSRVAVGFTADSQIYRLLSRGVGRHPPGKNAAAFEIL
jgi:hypothetical protein